MYYPVMFEEEVSKSYIVGAQSVWEPLAIEPCYYVAVTSVISGAIVGSTAQYMWLSCRTIRVEAEHQLC